MNYYNEFDPRAAAWLRELIKQGHIPPGEVDERSITDVTANDLSGFTQCHFFAGIGGWSLALRLAGWPEDRPVWTGSCPCQPFSAAGKGLGEKDERHLWPEFLRLISECRPATIFGEQVASKLGRQWLSGVFADLEDVGYAVAGADLCAAGVRAPHIRQRLWWMAYAAREQANTTNTEGLHAEPCGSSPACRMAHPNGRDTSQKREQRSGEHRQQQKDGCAGGLGDADRQGYEIRARIAGDDGKAFEQAPRQTTQQASSWSDFDVLPCLDGKARRVESGTFPLAHGIPGRVGLLRGYGNAIVPEAAAVFIEAAEEAIA